METNYSFTNKTNHLNPYSHFSNPIIFRQANLSKEVTIITATKGRLDAIHRLVESIASSGYGDLGVIVVNDRKPGLILFLFEIAQTYL